MSMHTLLVTLKHLIIHAITEAANHVSASCQCIKSGRCRSKATGAGWLSPRHVLSPAQQNRWPLLVRVIPNLPVPLLLGHDWPGFSATLSATSQPPASQKRTHGTKRPTWWEPTNPVSSVFYQVHLEWGFGREQKGEEGLKQCSAQV